MDDTGEWHTLDAVEVVKRLGSSIDNGLSSGEASRRLRVYGLNIIESRGGKRLYRIVLEQLLNLFMILLLVATVIAFLVGETSDAISIIAIVCVMITAGVVQEYRAEKALEKLKSLVIPKARVIRDGVLQEIDSRYIVPGDILVLQEGDRIVADARLVESSNLYVDESMLTGESLPILKKASTVLERNTPVADRVNMVYSGTYVVRGSGKAVVVATGMDTELGRIARMVVEASRFERTHLHKELDKLAKQLGSVIVGIAVLVLSLVIVLGIANPVDALLTSIALAVAAVPEGLPAVLTMILALSVLRMARRRALVRKLGAVEALGRVTVIATDKTGTLTRNEMTVKKIWLPEIGFLNVTGSGYLREGFIEVSGRVYKYGDLRQLDLLVEDAVLCNNASVDYNAEHPKPVGDPLEAALFVLGYKVGLDPIEYRDRFRRVKEIPFTSERMMMSVVVEGDRGYIVYSKGAPEVIVSKSRHVLTSHGVEKLGEDMAREILAYAEEMASKGLRVLAYAYKVVEEIPSDEDVEEDLVFIGLTGLIDPPRPEVPDAIKKAIEAGIRVVMVTGDHAVTARAVAEMIGWPLEGKRVVTGSELDEMSDRELEEVVEDVAIFARVSPEHKLRIVKAFKKRGHVIAMTGDGVNDAPALKLADIGVAMGLRGTDVAREAADLVLQDDNFATIVAAVEEGRTGYYNIRKATLYLLSANMAEVILVLSSILLLREIILTPAMILWINLVTDSIPAITLGLEPPEPGIMRIKPWDLKPLLGKTGLLYLGYIGVVLALLSWSLGRLPGTSIAAYSTATYLGLAIGELAHSFNMRSPGKSLLEIGLFKNKYHIVGYLVGMFASIAPLYTIPWLLRAVSLPLTTLLLIILLAHTMIVVEEVRKRLLTNIP